MQIAPLGDSALIVRVRDSLDEVRATMRQLEAADIEGVIEIAPAFASVAIFFHAAAFEIIAAKVQHAMDETMPTEKSTARPRLMEVPVCYDREFGLDLVELARASGFSPEEFAARHASAEYGVRCVGFTPGFPYLSGLPLELAAPRRAVPRQEIAAGAVAIGGAQTGIYPNKSPGGWNVIGRTRLRLFDVARDPPALFRAGDRVRFRQIARAEFDAFSE